MALLKNAGAASEKAAPRPAVETGRRDLQLSVSQPAPQVNLSLFVSLSVILSRFMVIQACPERAEVE